MNWNLRANLIGLKINLLFLFVLILITYANVLMLEKIVSWLDIGWLLIPETIKTNQLFFKFCNSIMHNQVLAILVSLLLYATVLVSANPAASIEEQHRAISLPNKFQLPNSFCIPVLCYIPYRCGSRLDTRGCSTCDCLPCDGNEWPWV